MADVYATQASELARSLADAHMAGWDNLYRYVAWAEANERRLKALRVHLDCEGEAKFSVWANEMIELDGLWQNADESIPAMYESLDELLDVLYAVVSTPVEPEESTALGERRNGSEETGA